MNSYDTPEPEVAVLGTQYARSDQDEAPSETTGLESKIPEERLRFVRNILAEWDKLTPEELEEANYAIWKATVNRSGI